MWEPYGGFYGLRGERWKLRPAFLYHERYHGWPEAVFSTKMRDPHLLADVRAAWFAGGRPSPRAAEYVDWDLGRAVGVTRHVVLMQKLQWLVHKILMSDTPFDDEVDQYAGGIGAAARRVTKGGVPIIRDTSVDVLQRLLQDDLVFMGKVCRHMWATLAEVQPAVGEMMSDADWGTAAQQLYELPVVEDDLDADHTKRYRAKRATVDARRTQALEEHVNLNARARAANAPASADGFLVRACQRVHGYEQSDALWTEHMEAYGTCPSG